MCESILKYWYQLSDSPKNTLFKFFSYLLTYLQSAQGPPRVLAWHSTRGRRACPWWMRPQTRQLRSGWSSLAHWRWHWPPTSARGGEDERLLLPTAEVKGHRERYYWLKNIEEKVARKRRIRNPIVHLCKYWLRIYQQIKFCWCAWPSC